MAVQQLAGVQVQRKIYVPDAGRVQADAFIRYLDVFSNLNAEPVSISVRIGSVGLGTGHLHDDMQIWRTSSDDAELEASDRWVLMDDGDSQGGLASITSIIHGSGARARPTLLRSAYADPEHPGALAWDYYDIEIEPGRSVALLSILVYEPLRVNNISEVYNLMRMREVDILDDMSDGDRRIVLNFDIDPENGAPLANAGGPYNADEGETVQLSAGNSSDPEGRSLSFEWDLDDDGIFEETESGSTATVVFPDNGNYQIRVRVTDEGIGECDEDGECGEGQVCNLLGRCAKQDVDSGIIRVRNLNPRIDGINVGGPVGEGEPFSLSIRAVDPGVDDLWTFDFDWDGDRTFDELGVQLEPDPQGNLIYSHIYLEDGTFNARVQINDDDGGAGVGLFRAEISNLPPTGSIIAPDRVGEGSPVLITVNARDPGQDPITYSYDFDYQGSFEVDQTGIDLNQLEISYPDNRLYLLVVRICDGQGGCSELEHPFSVLNTAPSIEEISNSGPIDEGDMVSISVSVSDPGADSHSYSYDFDGDGDWDLVDDPRNEVEYRYTQQGEYSVGVLVRDDDGEAGDYDASSTLIQVLNVPPQIELEGPRFVDEGQIFTLRAEVSDPGDDTLRFSWDLNGDGEFDRLGILESEQQVSLSQEGEHELRCLVNDGVDEQLATILIQARNIRPELSMLVPEEGEEGAEIAIGADVFDPGDDELRYSYDFDYMPGEENFFELEGVEESVVRWRFPDQGLYRIRIMVNDGANQTDGFAQIHINNAPPLVSLSSNSPLIEGEEIILSAELSDPGDDELTLFWDWDGDGEVDLEEPYEGQAEFRVTAPDNGRFQGSLRVDDEDQGSTTESVVLIVGNADPHFISIDLPVAREGELYEAVLPAEDPAGRNDPLIFSLIQPPGDAEIDSETGQLHWIPSYEAYLASPLMLNVLLEDGDQGSAEGHYEIQVLAMDQDEDGLPDTYERITCDLEGSSCLDPDDPEDALADPDSDGRDSLTEWQQGTEPFDYDGPQRPELLRPDPGEQLSTLLPELIIGTVESSLEDPIFIEFEIHLAPGPVMGDEGFPVIQSEPLLQGAGEERAWIPEQPLGEDQEYVWRARARSGQAISSWSELRGFRTNASNQNPSAPVSHSPPDGSVLSDPRPNLQVMASQDGDGDRLTYIFRLYHDDRVESSVIEGEGEIISYTPNARLVENARYEWEVVARDIDYATAPCPLEVPAEECGLSAPSERWSFVINSEEEAPSLPRLIYPEEYAKLDTLEPIFIAGDSSDPDTPELSYIFTLRSEDLELVEESEAILADSEDQSCYNDLCAYWTPSQLEEDRSYTLSVYSTDGERNSEVTEPISFFVSVENNPPNIPNPLSPANGSRLSPKDLILNWSESEDPEGDPLFYQVTVCDSAQECFSSSNQSGLGFKVDDHIEAGGEYSWSVEATDGTDSSGSSETWSFSVEERAGGGEDDCGCRLGLNRPFPWGLTLFGLLLLAGLKRRRAR